MVPEGWTISTFDDLDIQVVDGDRGNNYPKTSDYLDSGHCLFLGAANIINDRTDLTKAAFISEEKHKQMRKGTVKYGDLLLVMRGNGTGRVALYDESIPYKVARINSGLAIVRPSSKVSKEFLTYLMRSKIVTKQFNSYKFGSAQPQLTVKILKSLKFPTPILQEQQKIADILATWDRAIQILKRLIENSERQERALMQKLLTSTERLPSFIAPWSEVLLGSIASIEMGSSKSKYIDEAGENLIVDMGSVSREGRLIPSKRTRLSQDFLSKGHLVMPKDDIGGGNIIGLTGYIDQDRKYVLGDHVYKLTINDGDSRFFSYLINSYPVNKSLRRKANGTAQLGLGKGDVANQRLLVPALDEQKAIASILQSAEQEIGILRQRLECFKKERKALMQQLLTGKRRVKADSATKKAAAG